MNRRLIIRETEGVERTYSFLIDEPITPGDYSNQTLPDELIGEIESLGQSDDAPAFLWSPDGELIYTIALL